MYKIEDLFLYFGKIYFIFTYTVDNIKVNVAMMKNCMSFDKYQLHDMHCKVTNCLSMLFRHIISRVETNSKFFTLSLHCASYYHCVSAK